MKIAIGSDHAGFELKNQLVEYIKELGHEVQDFGTHEPTSVDYPTYAKIVSDEVVSNNFEQGILVCGTGVGISIAANKVKGIRAVVCSEPVSARLAREHNNANILCLGGRIVGLELAKTIVKEYINAKFDGDRHARRVGMICSLEE